MVRRPQRVEWTGLTIPDGTISYRIVGSLTLSPTPDNGYGKLHFTSLHFMALSRVLSEIFNVEKYRDFEIPVKGQSRSLKVVPFDTMDVVFY